MKRIGSLGSRFATAVALAVAASVILFTGNGVRLLDAQLVARENQRLEELRAFLNARIAAHLARKQYEPIRQELRQIRLNPDITYLVVVDRDQRIVVSDGWSSEGPLPPGVDKIEGVPAGAAAIDTFATLTQDGRVEGHVLFGLAVAHLRQAHRQLLWQSIGIGALAVMAAAAAMLGLSAAVTRDLRSLRRAAAAVEGGDMQMKLSVRRHDEIGELTLAFNRMTQALDDRMQALIKSEARFHAIADYTFGVEAWFNVDGRLIWINRSIERVTGYTPLECVLAGDLMELLVVSQDRRSAHEAFLHALQGHTAENFELRMQRKDGSVIWAALTWQPIYGSDGAYLGLRVSGEDISARKQAEIRLLDTVVELRREQSLKEYYLNRSDDERWRLAALLDTLNLGILFIGSDQRVVYCNRAFQRLWDFADGEVVDGMRDAVLLDLLDARLVDGAALRHHVGEAIRSRERSAEHESLLKDGRTLRDVSSLVSGGTAQRRLGRVWIYEDITEQKNVAAKLTQLAERDPLTSLYNRRRFHEELERNLADATRRRSELGILVMDLDGFKPINDEFGHQAGDHVLVTIAHEIGGIVRRNEMFFRLGGDEFAVLAPDATEFEMVGLAQRIATRIAELRFSFGARVSRITASIGIALFPQHAQNGEQLVAHADSAMYQAKTAGKNHWRVYRDPTRG